jgi:predicted DNA-binding helix-hairpin-helix protein
MEQLTRVVRRCVKSMIFAGYIHLKTIAEASRELIVRAGRYADRVSVNIELPSELSLRTLAPKRARARSSRRWRRSRRARGGEAGAQGAYIRAGRTKHAAHRGADAADDRSICA